MADKVEKTVLVKADIISNFVEAKKNVDEVRRSYKQLQDGLLNLEKDQKKIDKAFKDGIITKSELTEETKRISDSIVAHNKQLNEQAKTLAQANVKFREASKVIEGAARSEKLISEVSKEASGSLRALERDLNALRNVDISKLSEKDLPKWQDAISNTKKSIAQARFEIEKLDVSNAKMFSRIAEGFQVVSASATVTNAVYKEFGASGEELEKLNKTIVTLIGVTQALGVVVEYANKNKLKLLETTIKSRVEALQYNVALRARAAHIYKNTTATILWTVAQKALNLAMKAFPVAAVIVGVIALGKGISSLVNYFSASAKAQREAAKSLKEYEEQAKKTQRAIKDINTGETPEVERRKLGYEKEILEMQRLGATDEEISQRRAEQQKELTDFITNNSEERTAELNKEAESQDKAVKAQEKVIDALQKKYDEINEDVKDGNLWRIAAAERALKKLDEEKEKLAELTSAQKGLNAELQNEENIRGRAALDSSKATQETTTKQADKTKSDKLTDIGNQEKLNKALAEANKKFADDDFKKRQEHLLNIFNMEQNSAKQRLTIQKASGDITEKQYNQELAILAAERKSFNNEQKREQVNHSIELVKAEQESAKSKLESQKDLNNQSFAAQQKYSADMFKLEIDTEREILEMRKKNDTITADEYERQNKLLTDKQTKFNKEYVKAATDKIKSLQKETSALIQEQTDSDVADYKAASKLFLDELKKRASDQKEELDKARSGKGADGADVGDSELEDQYAETMANIAALQHKQEQDILEIKRKGLEAQKTLIDTKYDEIYSEQFEKAQNNQLKQLELEKKMLDERIKEKKRLGISTAADEAALEANKISTIEANAAKELATTARTAKQQYDIQRKALSDKIALYDKESELYDKNSLEYAQLLQERKELDADYKAQALEQVVQYAEMAMQAFSSINEIIGSLDQERLQRAEQQNAEEKDKYKMLLDSNMMSKAEHDKKVKESDEKLAKEKAKAARKQAIMAKAAAIFDIGMRTAQGIMGALAMAPPNIPLSVIVGAMGALQLAAVMAKPLPQAAKGKIIGGKSHAQGGTVIEAERGEAIVNKRSVGLFPELLSLINQAGGGVPFTPFSDGGFALREHQRQNGTSGIDYQELGRVMTSAVEGAQIFTAVEDINKANEMYVEVRDISF